MKNYKCNKVRFINETMAQLYIAKLKATSNREKIPKRAYLCEHCSAWHLTSSDENKDNWREKYIKQIIILKQIITNQNIKITTQREKLRELELILQKIKLKT